MELVSTQIKAVKQILGNYFRLEYKKKRIRVPLSLFFLNSVSVGSKPIATLVIAAYL